MEVRSFDINIPHIADIARPPVGTLVVVRWFDAWYDADEQEEKDWREDYPVETVGYLVRDNGIVLSIAQEVLPDGEGFRAVTHIPLVLMNTITRLTRG